MPQFFNSRVISGSSDVSGTATYNSGTDVLTVTQWPRQSPPAGLVKSGSAKFRKTGGGSCNVEVRDTDSGAVIYTSTLGTGNPAVDFREVALPNNYQMVAVGTSIVGTCTLLGWMDGD